MWCEDASVFDKVNCLTYLLGGSPVLNKEGGEVNSVFVDGSAASFSEFPVLPCCTLKERVIRTCLVENSKHVIMKMVKYSILT